jgi:hypothetical protein
MTDMQLDINGEDCTEYVKWQLEVDGIDYSNDFDHLVINTPAQVHVVPRNDKTSLHRVLGARGFTILIDNPSERLLALVDGGKQTYRIKPSVRGFAMPAPVNFHQEWTDPDGTRRMFGSLATDPSSGPLWVTEPVGADASGRE